MLQYKNILVPVDFSEISRLAIGKAIGARNTSQGQLILMHVIDYLPPPYAAAEVPAIFASEELMVERAEKHLNELAQELNAGDCQLVIRTGRAKKMLIEYIQDNDINLVVMAAHSNTAVEKLLGSTTNSVVQKAPCDVLVIHGQSGGQIGQSTVAALQAEYFKHIASAYLAHYASSRTYNHTVA